MTSETTMPDPVVEVDKHIVSSELQYTYLAPSGGLEHGTQLITTDQAEAYADARVREAEKSIMQSEQVQTWKRDSERLKFLTTPDSPWFLKRNIKNPYQFRMLFNGKPWGVYHLGARGTIDCAMAFHEYQQRI